MAEDAPIVADAPPPPAAPPSTPPVAPPPAPSTIAGGKVPPSDKPGTIADGGETVTGEEIKGDWPDDWRDKAAGGDEETAKLLKRFGSPKAVAKALKEARQQVSTKTAALPADATDEQKAAWRKERGVPDAPDGYEVAPPAGAEWTPEDKAYLSSFTKTAHDQGIPKAQFQALAQQYIDDQIARQQEQNLAVQKYQITSAKALRTEYGKDFEGTVEAVKNHLKEHLGAEGLEAFVNARMPNGALVGDNPLIFKYIADRALVDADGSPIEAGSLKGGVSDADTKKTHADLVRKRASGDKDAKRALADPAYQAKIDKVYEREAKAAERGSRAA